MRGWPWYSPVRATRRSATSRTGSPGTQRGGVAVGAEAEVDEVEALGQRGFVFARRRLEVALGDRHRPQRRLVVHREAEDHVGEVAVLAARGGDPLVDLEELGLVPGHLLEFAEDRQHRPGRAAAAHRHRELVALRRRLAPGGGDQLGGAARGRPFVAGDLELDRHGAQLAFSSWPPNCLRIAERTLSPKSPSPRE